MLIRLPEQVVIVLERDHHRRKSLTAEQFLSATTPFLLVAFDGAPGEGKHCFEAWQRSRLQGQYTFMDLLRLPELEAMLPSTKLRRRERPALFPETEATPPIVALSDMDLVWATMAGDVSRP